MRININRDILAGYVLVLLLVVGWFWIFSQSSSKEYDKVREDINGTIQIETNLRNLQISEFDGLMLAHIDFMVKKDVESLQALTSSIRRLNSSFALLQPRLMEINRPRVESAQQNIVSYFETIKDLEDITTNSTLNARLERIENFYTVQNNNLNLVRIDLESLRSVLAQDVSKRVNDLPSLLSSKFTLFYFLFAAIIIISATFGWFFSRKITTKINEVSEHLNTASEKILSAAQSEEEMFKTQSESLDRTAQTLDELSEFSKEVASNADNVSEKIEIAASSMSDLKNKAHEIGKITTTIDEITHQINILSLNASIEASRAGEQGKGFSAVALEIRKLAENTRGFTDNITRLIKDIQSNTVDTVDLTNNSVNLVRRITDSVNKQNNATEEINTAVSDINDSMKTSVENIRETVESSENIHKLSNQLKAMT
ncbi:methyl-accepting chemotaxis protein [candidate division KSB1 bacterium]